MLAGIHFFSASSLAISLTDNHLLAFALGFLLHHLEDALPHLDLNVFNDERNRSIKNWTKGIWTLVISEFILFFILTFYFLDRFPFQKQLVALIGGIGSLVPDIISFSINSFFPKFKILSFYQRIHGEYHFKLRGRNYLLPIITTILVIMFSVILFNRHST